MIAPKKSALEKMYLREGKSMKTIAEELHCSVHRVQYWLQKFNIQRRSISEAIYQWHNPNGDPFLYSPPRTSKDHILFGMGIGLYWGEGTKADQNTVRLGNTDPALLKNFLAFLERFFQIRRQDCRFGLQIFTDINQNEALDFWIKQLKISKSQFYKVTTTVSGSIGTYRQKSRYGVLTIYYNNKKLRNLLVKILTQHGYLQTSSRPSSVVEQHNGNV